VRTRRALLGSALAAALGRRLAGPAEAGAAAVQRRAGTVEVAALRALIDREDAAAQAYALAAQATADPLLARLRDDDRVHGRALRSQLEALTVSKAAPGPGLAGQDADAAPLASARRPDDARRAAIALEDTLVTAYGDAIGELLDDGLLQTVAAVMAAHAQALAALRLASGRPPLAAGDATAAA
jgi:hypothetical protein